MTKVEALAIIRGDEQEALGQLERRPAEGVRDRAYTVICIARETYAAIEAPPTRHQSFSIRTFWDMPSRHATAHGVFADYPGWGQRQVVDDRPGLFGSGDVRKEIRVTTEIA